MNAIFDKLNINYIIVEEGQNQATIDALVVQNNKSFNTRLVLDFTDLNRLFLKLNMQGAAVSISENFSCYQTENGNLYTLDMSDFGWEGIDINEFTPLHAVRQIRA